MNPLLHLKYPSRFKFAIIFFFIALILFIVLSVVQTFAQATFSAQTDFTVGNSPYGTATGDLNGDGKPDLVVNSGFDKASVLLNTTTPGASVPTFTAKTDFTTGQNAQYIEIGDLNGDGKPDLVSANYSASSVSVLLNTTTTGSFTPTFTSKTDISTGGSASCVVIADINGDGKQDLVVSVTSTNTVSIFLNTTAAGALTPTFSAATSFVVSSFDYSVAVGDFNGDGKPDFVATNVNTNSVSVFLNTTATGASTPTFSAKTDFGIGIRPQSVSVCDFNNDGKQDIVTTNNGGYGATVILNTTITGASTPSFSAVTNLETSSAPQQIRTSDLNNDGKPDITVACYNGYVISVLLNTTTPGASTPTFTTTQNFSAGTHIASVSVCDFNGDGKADLAASNSFGIVSILMNTMTLGVAAPSLSGVTTFSSYSNPAGITNADFNGDGKPDMAFADYGFNSIIVYLNTTTPGASSPTFGGGITISGISGAYLVLSSDFNGDGKPDIAVSNSSASMISVYLNTTTPGASTPTFSGKTDFSVGTTPYYFAMGDFNGDGKKDIAAANYGSNTISVLLNTTTPGASTATFSAKTDFTSGTNPYDVVIADINGDGKTDIIESNDGANTVSVLLNTTTTGASTPTFSAKTDFAAGLRPQVISMADYNGDGKPDIAVGNANSASVSVLLNTTTSGAATPTFSAKTDFAAGAASFYTAAADFNCDGKPDIVVSNYNANTISIFINNTVTGASTPSFTSSYNYSTVFNSPAGISIADINKDGKPDINLANNNGASVSVFLNTAILPLPVELASFTSSLNGNNVTLQWNTTMEENNKGFDIERNSFGAGWKKVGCAEGHGTTNQTINYTFTERGVATGYYNYRLKQIDYNGNYKYYDLSNEVIIGIPSKYSLAQNYPNPFNPATVISYQIPASAFVSLKVFDIRGREAASIVNEVKEAGYYSVTFDAKNLSSGTYFYKLSTDKFSAMKKMVVVK